LAPSPVIDCRFGLFPSRKLSARLANAPCEVCEREPEGTDSGDDRPIAYDVVEVVRLLPSNTFESPSLGDPSGLGVTIPAIISSSFVPDNEIPLGLLNAVVGDALTCPDPFVNACLAENILDADPGRDEVDDLRDVGLS